MTGHDLFAEGVYFAHPASPWCAWHERGTNGLLQQYFPKGTDPSARDGYRGVGMVGDDRTGSDDNVPPFVVVPLWHDSSFLPPEIRRG